MFLFIKTTDSARNVIKKKKIEQQTLFIFKANIFTFTILWHLIFIIWELHTHTHSTAC